MNIHNNITCIAGNIKIRQPEDFKNEVKSGQLDLDKINKVVSNLKINYGQTYEARTISQNLKEAIAGKRAFYKSANTSLCKKIAYSFSLYSRFGAINKAEKLLNRIKTDFETLNQGDSIEARTELLKDKEPLSKREAAEQHLNELRDPISISKKVSSKNSRLDAITNSNKQKAPAQNTLVVPVQNVLVKHPEVNRGYSKMSQNRNEAEKANRENYRDFTPDELKTSLQNNQPSKKSFFTWITSS